MNDQAETFLMNLIRGSGIEGLSGMKPVRPFRPEASSSDAPEVHPILLIRPLLTWAKRSDTENFCHRLGIEFRYDSMNEDTAFRRVRIRKVLLPLLKDFNPNIVERLAATAQMLGDTVDGAGPAEAELPEKLSLEALSGKDRPELHSVIRLWLKQRRGDLRSINLKHIEAVGRLVHSQKSGRLVEIPGGGAVVKAKGALEFRKIEVEKPSNGN
jgi:tRNA(Ile)-lysidine synthase